MTTARVFWSGHSQAIRLPKEFRLPPETSKVSIRRRGEQIILEPVKAKEWPESFWQAFGDMPEDFERPRQRPQSRESLDL